ncbi:hypothetical protein GCM10022239_14040 [Leifsonia bigeumensis]|uniref:Uncharacterized protein n=1 Tax=Leifsonella bigeumensis TaxID=433643 RepID=A0ABP7FK68_9MICO
MSESTEADDRDEASPGDTSEIASPRKLNVKLLAIVGGGVLVLALAAGIVLVLTQPTAIQRAGDACSGSKPFQALLNEENITSSPSPTTDSDKPKEDSDFIDKIFDGVVTVEDGGKTLIVRTKPKDDDILGISTLALDCVYEQLDMPKYLTEEIGVTRALDGRQAGEWADYTASWSYHPDNGMNLIIVQK